MDDSGVPEVCCVERWFLTRRSARESAKLDKDVCSSTILSSLVYLLLLHIVLR